MKDEKQRNQSTGDCSGSGLLDEIDLHLFMAAIFSDAVGVPVVASPDHKGFRSQRYIKGVEPKGEQLYFCISTVADIPRASLLHRRAADLVRTYCVTLDDCGTKVPMPNVPPSYALESSPGNYQYGYIIDGGAEPAEASALIDALAAGGHTDPGATGATRVVRVPGSLNVKRGDGWRARLSDWHPERRFSLPQLAQSFGLALGIARAEPEMPNLKDGENDRVFDWLVGHDMVKTGSNPRGWFSITCPWEDAHQTPPFDHGADYHPGSPGAFKCFHGSCAQRTTADLKAWIAEEDPEADIDVISRELVTSVAKLLRAITLPSMTLRERLALQIRGVLLGPHVLPDCTRTVKGNVAMRQAVTEVRIEHVLRLIGATVRHNSMNGDIEIAFADYQSVSDPSDAGMATIVHACDQCGMTGATSIRQAVVNIAMTNTFHPAEDWIRSAPWDGLDRLSALCESVVMRDASQNRWRDVVIKRWSLQVVTAMLNYKLGDAALDVGYVPVLQGPQGVGKTRWLRSLLPVEFVSLGLSLRLDGNERDAVTRATAKLIGELGELDHSFRRSDQAATKNFLTTSVDIYRPPYAVKESRRARCTAFAATVNPAGFLIDATGERRYWPLAVARCNWHHGVNMQQFWAQMLHRREQGEQYWLNADEIALHVAATKEHHVETDIGFVVQDLIWRRDAFPDVTTWVHASAKEILQHNNARTYSTAYTDLNSALAQAGFVRTIVRGKAGWRVPPYKTPFTPAQQAGFKVVM